MKEVAKELLKEHLTQVFKDYPSVYKFQFVLTRKSHSETSASWKINDAALPLSLMRTFISQPFVEDDNFRSWCVEIGVTSSQALELIKVIKELPRTESFAWESRD